MKLKALALSLALSLPPLLGVFPASAGFKGGVNVYPPPSVSSVTPNGGSTSGGESVSIRGTNFENVLAVLFGNVQALYSVVATNQITAVNPGGVAAGNVDVKVVTTAGITPLVTADTFSLAPPGAPLVSSVTPLTGNVVGGDTVVVAGNGMTGATAVKFGATNAASVSGVTATQLTATTPAGSAGLVDVTVTNPSGTSVVNPYDKFLYAVSPAVSSLTPRSDSTNGGVTVTINGFGFVSGSTSVSFGGVAGTSVNVSSPSKLTVVSPPGSLGTVDVTVTVSGVTSATGSFDQFTYSNFTDSLPVGQNDPNGQYLTSSEMRGIEWVSFQNGQTLPDGTTCGLTTCKVLFAMGGLWMDQNCPSTQGPQIYALTKSLGSWYLDATLAPIGAGCGGNNGNAFNNINSSHSFLDQYDGAGAAVPSNLQQQVLVGGTARSMYARNNALTSNQWINVTIPGSGGVSRAIGDYRDTSSGAAGGHVHYAFFGNDQDGMHAGTFTQSPWGWTVSGTAEAFCFVASGTSCTTPCTFNGSSPPAPNRNQMDCVNVNKLWPYNLSVTSGSSNGTSVTLNWATPLLVPMTPGFSQVVVSGVTGCTGTGTNVNATQLVTAATLTSVTFATTKSCTGYNTGNITENTTPQQLTLNFAALAKVPTGNVVIASVANWAGTNPNATWPILSATTTSVTVQVGTDCSACTGGNVSFTTPNVVNNKPVNNWQNCPGDSDQNGTVIGCSIPNIRVVGLTHCFGSNIPQNANVRNSFGEIMYAAAGMAVWKRVNNGPNSIWIPHAAVPWAASNSNVNAGAGYTTGQPQLRGLSCIKDSTKASGYALLAHIEGEGNVWNIDTDTGVMTAEDNLVTELGNQWGGGGGYGIHFYNNEGVYFYHNPVNNQDYYMGGEGDSSITPTSRPFEQQGSGTAKWESVSGMWIRSAAVPTAPTWTVWPPSGAIKNQLLGVIHPSQVITYAPVPPNLGPGTAGSLSPIMISTRVGPVASQFPEDLDGNGYSTVFFLGGMDRNQIPVKSPANNTGWLARFPTTLVTWPVGSSPTTSITNVLPNYSNASVNWANAGLSSIGGIPNRTTQCGATLTPSGGDDLTQIQNAINSCTAGQFVQLGAGTFKVSAQTANHHIWINKGITLRGTGTCNGGSSPYCATVLSASPGGANQTYLTGASNCTGCDGAVGPFIYMSPNDTLFGNFPNTWSGCNWSTACNGASGTTALTANANQGDTTISVASTTGFSVGMFVRIDEAAGASTFTFNGGSVFGDTNFTLGSGSPAVGKIVYGQATVEDGVAYGALYDRESSEIHKITAIGSGTLTFDTPLTIGFRTGSPHFAQVYQPSSAFLQQAGIENLSIVGATGGKGPVSMSFCAYCWIKNVETKYWVGGVIISNSIRDQVTGSYLHDCSDCENNGNEYPIAIDGATTETLVDNNIILLSGKGMVGRSCGGGNVVAYNYEDETFYQASSLGNYWLDTGLNGTHYTGCHHMLFEGNWGNNGEADNTHGNIMYHTWFQNYLTGLRSNFNDPSFANPASSTYLPANAPVSDLNGIGYAHGQAYPWTPGQRHAVGWMSQDYWHSYVGNVLGTPGVSTAANGWTYYNPSATQGQQDKSIWMIGWVGGGNTDPNTSFFFRHANYDAVNAGIADYATGTPCGAGIACSTLLPNSFYLSGAPSFFGNGATCTYTWPWVNSSGTPPVKTSGGVGSCGSYSGLPAKARIDAGTPFVQP